MNCNCISEFKNKLLETQPLKNLVITDVSLPTILQFGEGVTQDRLMIEAECEISGLRRPKKITVAYAFCPFCGKSAEKKNLLKNLGYKFLGQDSVAEAVEGYSKHTIEIPEEVISIIREYFQRHCLVTTKFKPIVLEEKNERENNSSIQQELLLKIKESGLSGDFVLNFEAYAILTRINFQNFPPIKFEFYKAI